MNCISGSVIAAMGARLRSRDGVTLVAVTVALLAGCGPRRAETYPLTGVVRFAGKPVEAATVSFFPTGGRPANGVTDAAGRFQVRTWSAADGALPGEHVVCISKQVPDPTAGADYLGLRHVLPEQYASPARSPLRATVTANGPNDFAFELN